MNATIRNVAHTGSLHGDIWAVEPDRMRAYMATFTEQQLNVEDYDARCCPRKLEYFGLDGEPSAAVGTGSSSLVGVIPLVGPITHRGSMFTSFFGGTSLTKWQQSFADMASNPAVGAIVMDIDSPGGSVAGVDETADMIRAVARTKPVLAVSNTTMASAAYYLGSQATELLVSPSSMIGSVGVYSLHVDFSEALKNMGIKATFIFAGKHKTEGNMYEPISSDALAAEQLIVDSYYQEFVEAVAKGRKTTVTDVKQKYGQGRMLRPQAAVEAGMADRVGTLGAAIRQAGGILQQQRRDRAAVARRQREYVLADY